MKKIYSRVLLIMVYFLIDLSYMLWKAGTFDIQIVIERVIIFFAIGISIYWITNNEKLERE